MKNNFYDIETSLSFTIRHCPLDLDKNVEVYGDFQKDYEIRLDICSDLKSKIIFLDLRLMCNEWFQLKVQGKSERSLFSF